MEIRELRKIIDHTMLKPESTFENFQNFCNEAKEYQFGCVAVLPNMVLWAKNFLEGSEIKICTAIAFPEGTIPIKLKILEIEDAIKNGSSELDMVINIAEVKLHNYKYIENELKELRKNTLPFISKIIIETSILSKNEILTLTKIACENEIDFIKTSTGFKGKIATLDAVKTIKSGIFGKTQIKAAGGIKNLQDALVMIEAGVKRLGTSNGKTIINEFLQN